jgi:hypothetical protein
MSRFISIIILTTLLSGCAHPPRDTTVDSRPIEKVPVSTVPFEKQFTLREGDAYEFSLPSHKTVAVWCKRPPSWMPMAEQSTASGLKTVWGERAFQRPEPLKK